MEEPARPISSPPYSPPDPTCQPAHPGSPGVHPPIILLLFRALFRDRSQLALEKSRPPSAARHPPSQGPPTQVTPVDRAFWMSLARVWEQWRSALILVKPETVIRWHRQDSGYFWRWSRGVARASVRNPSADPSDVQENPLLGRPAHPFGTPAPRQQCRRATVARYMTRRAEGLPHRPGAPFFGITFAPWHPAIFFVSHATFRLCFASSS